MYLWQHIRQLVGLFLSCQAQEANLTSNRLFLKIFLSFFSRSLSLSFLHSLLKYMYAALTLLFKNIMGTFLFSAQSIPLFPFLITAVSYLSFIDTFTPNLSLCYKVVRIEIFWEQRKRIQVYGSKSEEVEAAVRAQSSSHLSRKEDLKSPKGER